ncbi:MAG TPA: molecular chaperone TorD family protein [Blastocatellia bacterium]|nr:molecular chaperone TorD family protein [Blastocatellia bacterium]
MSDPGTTTTASSASTDPSGAWGLAGPATAEEAQFAGEATSLLAHRDLWLLVSVGFVDPYHRDRFAMLTDAAFRQRVIEAAAVVADEHPNVEIGPGERSPHELSPGALFALLDNEAHRIQATYRQVFGLTAISPTCPPCETEWEPNTDIFYRCQRLADIAGFYHAFGLELSPSCGERLDHISVEAEFLYVLLAKEAAALADGDHEAVDICRDARRKFFQEHVGWWVPAFARSVERVAPPGYYRQLAQFTAALSAAERLSLTLPPFTVPMIPRPSLNEAPVACEECG